MPEIIDILVPDPADLTHFTANNAVDYVQTTSPASFPKLKTADGKYIFAPGDNFSIISTGFIMPESFTFWRDRAALIALPALPAQIGFLYILDNATGDIYTIDSLGMNPRIFYPMENYEMILDVYIDTTKQRKFLPPNNFLSTSFYLTLQFLAFPISTRGQPTYFNGKTFVITPFIKIAHNSRLT